jgi:hypothetical protein
VISEEDVEKLAAAARVLPPNASTYVEEDFVMNLLETLLRGGRSPRLEMGESVVQRRL